MSKIHGIKLIEPRPAVGGYIKIGRTVSGQNQKGAYTRPEKHDHFEVTTSWREGGAEDNLALDRAILDRVIALGGDQIPLCGGCERSKALGYPGGLPRRLPVYLPADEVEAVFPHWLALYKGRTRFCHGDGDKALRCKVTKDKNGIDVYGEAEPFGPCGNACPDLQAARCKPQGILRVCIGVQQSVGTLYEFRTTSWNSIRNLLGSLEWLRRVTGGVQQFIPLFLDLTPRTVKPKDGRPSRAWVVTLSYPGSPVELARIAAGELAEYAGARKQLAAFVRRLDDEPEPGDVAAAVESEFYPLGEGEVVDTETGEVLLAGDATTSGNRAPSPSAEVSRGTPASQDAPGSTISGQPASQDPLPDDRDEPESAPRERSLSDRWHADLGLTLPGGFEASLTPVQVLAARSWCEGAAEARLRGIDPPLVPHFLRVAVPETFAKHLPDSVKAREPKQKKAPPAPEQPALPAAPVAGGEDAESPKIDAEQRKALIGNLKQIGIVNPVGALSWIRERLGRFDTIKTTGDITVAELAKLELAIVDVVHQKAKAAEPEY